MESNVLATVLTSSVVAGVISSLVAYFQFHKNNKLVYITNERKAWRSDIRRIAEEIEAATGYEDIRKPLVELKVRINAYGKNTDDVKKDSHIWKVIERLQKQNDDFDEAKQLLILYLFKNRAYEGIYYTSWFIDVRSLYRQAGRLCTEG